MNTFDFLKECGVRVKKYLYTDYWHPGVPLKYEVVYKDTSNKSDKCVMLQHPQKKGMLLKVAFTDCFSSLAFIDDKFSKEGTELRMKAGYMKEVKEVISYLEEIPKDNPCFVTRLLYDLEKEEIPCITM